MSSSSPMPCPGVAEAMAARLGARRGGRQHRRAAGARTGRRGDLLLDPDPSPAAASGRGRRVPTFCEKPIAEDPYAAGDLDRDGGVDPGSPVQIGFPRRFDPAFQAAKAAFDAGELGWLTTVRSTTLDPHPRPRPTWPCPGGIFRDCAIHDLDAVRWVTGRDVVEVYAVGSNRGDRPSSPSRRRRHGFGAADLRRRHTRSDLQHPLQRRRATTSDWSSTAPQGSVAAGLDDGLPLRSADPESGSPPVRRTRSSWTGSPTAFRNELATFVEVAAGAAVAVHRHRRAGGQLDRRGLHPILARAPTGPAGRSAPGPTGVARSRFTRTQKLAHAIALIMLSFRVEPDPPRR